MNADRLIRIPPEEKRQLRQAAKEMGICTNCLSNKATRGPRGGTGLCDYCRERARAVNLREYGKHREELKASFQERADRLRAESRCHTCGNPVNEVLSNGKVPWRCKSCRARSSEIRKPSEKNQRQTNRAKVIALYGGKCHDCGYGDARALELHHILHNGKDDGDKRGRGSRAVYRILRDGYDPTLVLICANCHRIRHYVATYG